MTIVKTKLDRRSFIKSSVFVITSYSIHYTKLYEGEVARGHRLREVHALRQRRRDRARHVKAEQHRRNHGEGDDAEEDESQNAGQGVIPRRGGSPEFGFRNNFV